MKNFINRLISFSAPTFTDWLIYFGILFILHIPGILAFPNGTSNSNAYLLFAQSMLDGTLVLPPMDAYGDMIVYKNQCYLPYPPLPSVLLLPFVAVFGMGNVNTVFIAFAVSCINLYLLHRIFLKLQISKIYFPWLAVAFFFGTGYLYVMLTSQHRYAFAHITAVMFTLLFINELLGKQRWWLIGIFIGCSFLTRQFTLFLIVFAIGYFIHQQRKAQQSIQWTKLFALLASFSVFVFIYLLYNYLRFGNFLDSGYKHIVYIGVLKERVNQYGVFSIHYFLFNLYTVFIKGFNIIFEGSGLMKIKDVDLWGTSLLVASPFLIASLKANWDKNLKFWSWITILLILSGTLFYHNNGFNQINTMRFTLDFLPLLFVLTALGIQKIPFWLIKGMIIYAIILNVIGFAIHLFYQ